MDRIIASHPDGRRYSVSEDAFRRLYEPQGFVAGGPEQPSDFIADVPAAPSRAKLLERAAELGIDVPKKATKAQIADAIAAAAPAGEGVETSTEAAG